MLLALFFAYNFLPSIWFLCLTSTFFIPQIVHNAMRGQRYRFDILYVFLLGFMRVAAPVSIFLIMKFTKSNSSSMQEDVQKPYSNSLPVSLFLSFTLVLLHSR